MSSMLNSMIIAFSKETRINRKEIIEIEMVDFFMKYGEVDAIEEFLE